MLSIRGRTQERPSKKDKTRSEEDHHNTLSQDYYPSSGGLWVKEYNSLGSGGLMPIVPGWGSAGLLPYQGIEDEYRLVPVPSYDLEEMQLAPPHKVKQLRHEQKRKSESRLLSKRAKKARLKLRGAGHSNKNNYDTSSSVSTSSGTEDDDTSTTSDDNKSQDTSLESEYSKSDQYNSSSGEDTSIDTDVDDSHTLNSENESTDTPDSRYTSSETSEDSRSDTSSETSKDSSSDTSSETSKDSRSDTSSETSKDSRSDKSSETSKDSRSDSSLVDQSSSTYNTNESNNSDSSESNLSDNIKTVDQMNTTSESEYSSENTFSEKSRKGVAESKSDKDVSLDSDSEKVYKIARPSAKSSNKLSPDLKDLSRSGLNSIQYSKTEQSKNVKRPKAEKIKKSSTKKKEQPDSVEKPYDSSKVTTGNPRSDMPETYKSKFSRALGQIEDDEDLIEAEYENYKNPGSSMSSFPTDQTHLIDDRSNVKETQLKQITKDVIVDRALYDKIDFNHPLKAVGQLALLFFGQDVMATHSVTGKTMKTGTRKEQLPQDMLTQIIDHVYTKFYRFRGPNAKIMDINKERVPLTIRLLRLAVMQKCYSCAAKNTKAINSK